MYGNYRPREIANFPAYSVSDDGRIWTSYCKGRGGRVGSAWRVLTPTLDRQGYRIVRLYGEGGAWKQRRVCRLVCEAFYGPAEPGHECRHLDGNPANDAVSNLALGNLGAEQGRPETPRYGTAWRDAPQRHVDGRAGCRDSRPQGQDASTQDRSQVRHHAGLRQRASICHGQAQDHIQGVDRMKKAPAVLDAIADRVLAYRPKPKSKPARKRARRRKQAHSKSSI